MPGLNYPLAFVLAGAGFLFILLIEAVMVADHPGPSFLLLHVGPRSGSHNGSPQALTVNPHPVIYVLLQALSIHSLIVGTQTLPSLETPAYMKIVETARKSDNSVCISSWLL